MNSYTVDVHRLAILDVRKAYTWYHQRSKQTASRFQLAVETLIERIQSSPLTFQPHLYDTRFGKLPKFPYLVIFEVHGFQCRVITVIHTKRKPGVWIRRRTNT